MIDPTADRAVYKQLADLIRAEIQSGRLAPGQRIAGEHDYAAEHGISRHSVRATMALLRSEGLITTDRTGSRVRERGEMSHIEIGAGDVVSARMPTEPERREWRIGDGVPVFVVVKGGREVVYPADRFAVRAANP